VAMGRIIGDGGCKQQSGVFITLRGSHRSCSAPEIAKLQFRSRLASETSQ
jgi:hypothetical protein